MARPPSVRAGAVPASNPATTPLVPSRRQALALLAVLALVAGTTAVVSYLVRPDRARTFDLLHGSVFLSDAVAPVAVDLASGRPTIRLVQAARQVGARTTADLTVVPVADGTVLLNRRTGEFDMVASTGFVVKTDGGVAVPRRQGSTAAIGIASGHQAYIAKTGPTGTSVYLVGQDTVQAAATSATIRPRAMASMSEAISTAPGSTVAARGDLWLLAGTGATRTVRRLHVPAGSAPGVRLAASDRGTVPAVSALEATTSGAVGVADNDSILVMRDSTTRRVGFPRVAGADTVLAATQSADRLSFLVHGTRGWQIVSVDADGGDLRGPTRLAHVASGADLAPPAASAGSLYAVDRSTGWTYRIDTDGTSALAAYPLARESGKVIEPGGYGDAYVISRGDRVIVNSPSHLDALVLFTDGSHRPLTIEKSSAVSVSASSGADALTRSGHAQNRTRATSRTTSERRSVSPVDTTVDCSKIHQQPHIPSIAGAVPGSTSVDLSWRYPTTSVQDCLPSTYVVTATSSTAGAPSPTPTTVQGQTSAVVTGLFPSSRYDITVTAYLNGQSTTSTPLSVTTGRAGPPAPTDVRAVTDDAGNWQVSWHSCGTTASGCVPTVRWTVVPQYCDGLSASAAPAPVTVAADPGAVVQPPAHIVGGDALLGRGLRFLVEGTGVDGAVSAPSSSTACTYSWTPPVASDISVQASTPPTAGPNSSTTATVQFANGAVHDLGGVGGTLTYRLIDPSGNVVATRGPTTQQSADLGGIAPGQHYSVQVVASPPRHPQDAVTLPAVAVTPAQQTWPTPEVLASFATDNALQGTLSVSFQLPGTGDLHGETFDLVEGSSLACDGQQKPLDGSDIRPGQTTTYTVDRTQWSGSCRVQLVLSQHLSTQTDPPLFASGFSPQGSDAVTIDAPVRTTTAADFTASWNADYQPTVQLAYSGSDQLAQLATDWSITVGNGASADCGSRGAGPDIAAIAIDPSCVLAGGPFTLHVAYDYAGQSENFAIDVAGGAPDPVRAADITFAASWNSDASTPAVVFSESGPITSAVLTQLHWTATVTANGTTCGTSTAAPAADGTISVAIDYSACPPTDGAYQTTVDFTDPVFGGRAEYTPSVDGTPPS